MNPTTGPAPIRPPTAASFAPTALVVCKQTPLPAAVLAAVVVPLTVAEAGAAVTAAVIPETFAAATVPATGAEAVVGAEIVAAAGVPLEATGAATCVNKGPVPSITPLPAAVTAPLIIAIVLSSFNLQKLLIDIFNNSYKVP